MSVTLPPTIVSGQRVLSVSWLEPESSTYEPAEEDNEELIYLSENHGDHAENWILRVVNGREESRWNTRTMDAINWDYGEEDPRAGLTADGHAPSKVYPAEPGEIES